MTAPLTRGSTITFTATCLDAAGNPTSPESATLHLVYAPADGGHARAREQVACVVSGNEVRADWDSSVASVSMPVHWHIRASGAGEAVAADGSFTLQAGEANPAA